MANFEGEKNLNRETSELEVKGKYKLSEEELDNVAGGCGDDGSGENSDSNENKDPHENCILINGIWRHIVQRHWACFCGRKPGGSCGNCGYCCEREGIYYCSYIAA